MTVGPYVLQSLLMAFERWLFDYAKSHPDGLDAVLLEVLQRSDSAALAAVVASVATAFPHRSGEALLALLSVQNYIEIDRSRMAREHHTSSPAGLFPTSPRRRQDLRRGAEGVQRAAAP
jgi:hypothetical protein